MPQSMPNIKGFIKNNPFSKNNDALVILGIVCIVLMLVVPIPPILLDVLLTCMIGIALMVLMISMVIDRVLDFAVYPSLLLVVTLFRLSLNVASTRLILADGNAGQVIQTFGTFVTKGNFIVGTIIFLILVLIDRKSVV